MALALADSTGKSVLVDFTASWCGPCQMMSPHFEALAREFDGQMTFLKVDVDQNQETAAYCEIRAMPTFKVYRGFQEVGAMRGANAEGLRQLVLTELSGRPHRPSAADSSRPAGPPPQRPARSAAEQEQAQQVQKAAMAAMLGDPSNRAAAQTCLSTLLKMVANVLSNPAEMKFRSVKADNKAIKEKVLTCPGGRQLLEAAGFAYQSDQPLTSTPACFTLAADANLSELAQVKQGIETVLAHMGGA